MRVHLIGNNQGTACGQNAGWGVPDTDDPAKVTCKRCRATAWFAVTLRDYVAPLLAPNPKETP